MRDFVGTWTLVALSLTPAAVPAQTPAGAKMAPASGLSLALSAAVGVGFAGGEVARGLDAGEHLGVPPALTLDAGVRWGRVAVTGFMQYHYGLPSSSTGLDGTNGALMGLRGAWEPGGDRWLPWVGAGVGVAGSAGGRSVNGNDVTDWTARGPGVIAAAGLDRRLGERLAAGLAASASWAQLRTQYAYDASGEQAGSTAIRVPLYFVTISARVRY
jgi:hypothetical protein